MPKKTTPVLILPGCPREDGHSTRLVFAFADAATEGDIGRTGRFLATAEALGATS